MISLIRRFTVELMKHGNSILIFYGIYLFIFYFLFVVVCESWFLVFDLNLVW